MSPDCASVGGEYMETIAAFTGTNFFDGVYCFYADQVGATLLAMFVLGSVTIGMIRWSETIVLPVVVAIIVSPIVLVALPVVATNLFGIAVVLMIPIALLLVARRIDRSVG